MDGKRVHKISICVNAVKYLPIPPIYGGGVEEVIANLLLKLAKKGILFHLVVNEENVPEKSIHKRIIYHGVQCGRILTTLRTLNTCLRTDYDILHTFGLMITSNILARRIISKPLLFSQYGHSVLLEPDDSYIPKRIWTLHRSQWLLYKEANKVAVPSTIIKRTIVQKYRTNPNKIEVVPHAVDLDFFNPKNKGDAIREEYKLNPETTMFLYVGRFVPPKGVEEILHATKKLKKTFPDIRVMFLGPKRAHFSRGSIASKSPFFDRMREFVLKNKIEKNIIFVDPVSRDKLKEYYAAADVFVFPSREEAFGLVLAEAMASGLPVITLDNPPLNEIIDDTAGILLQPHNLGTLAEAMKKLIIDKDLADRMGRCGREIVERRFSWDLKAQRYIQLYRKLLHHT